jgi:hypothetical protein
MKVQVCPAVRKIDSFLFSKCFQLRSVELPEGLEEIGQCAFADCCQLNGILIPQSVKGILNWAFKGYIKFTTVKIPLGIKVIATNASIGWGSRQQYGQLFLTAVKMKTDDDDESIGWPPGIYASVLYD